jgi:autophagy-related protein 17
MASPQQPESPLSASESIDPRNLSLGELVDIFLASKRSLSCIDQVRKGREIVEAARDAIEENAILHAKTVFVRYALDLQTEMLDAVRHGARLIESDGHQELQVLNPIAWRVIANIGRTP